jgi:hypothetical protein
MYSEYYDTDDTLRDTLTVEVSEQVDMMEVCCGVSEKG